MLYPIQNHNVKKLVGIHLNGDVIPSHWYDLSEFKYTRKQNCKSKDGMQVVEVQKTNRDAILVMASILYWFRPLEKRDELTDRTVGYYQKFQKDKLQRTTKAIVDKFGMTDTEAREVLDFLEEKNLIKTEIIKAEIIDGKKYGNVQYIDLVPETLEVLITLPSNEPYPYVSNETDPMFQMNHTPMFQMKQTNTENTLTKNTTKNIKDETSLRSVENTQTNLKKETLKRGSKKRIISEELENELIEHVLPAFNETMGKKQKSIIGLEKNYEFWRENFELDEIVTAIKAIPKSDFWKDKMNLTILLRKKNRQNEEVNYIQEMLNLIDDFETQNQTDDESDFFEQFVSRTDSHQAQSQTPVERIASFIQKLQPVKETTETEVFSNQSVLAF